MRSRISIPKDKKINLGNTRKRKAHKNHPWRRIAHEEHMLTRLKKQDKDSARKPADSTFQETD